MRSFAEIIDLWQTSGALVADLEALGVSVKSVTVRAWRKDGINGRYWDAVVQAAWRRGFTQVTHELLCRLGRVPATKRERPA